MPVTYQSDSCDFQAFFVSFVHVHNAICCKCGWMEKKALFHHRYIRYKYK